jgi:hypothetical protein
LVVIEGTKFEARTNMDGYYEIRGLPYPRDKMGVTLYAAFANYLPSRLVASRLLPDQIVVYDLSLTAIREIGWIDFLASDSGSYPVYQGVDTIQLGRTTFTYTQVADTTLTYTLKDARGHTVCRDTLRLGKYDAIRMVCDIGQRRFEIRSHQ